MLTVEDFTIITPRFWAKVNKDGPIPEEYPELGPCWIWVGGRSGNGYGYIHYQHKQYKANRLAWFIETGRWPNIWALHKCDNPRCVRFAHLFEGNNADNIRDAARKGKYSDPARIARMQQGQRDAWMRRLLRGMAC